MFRFVVLYIALALGANSVGAQSALADTAALEALRDGTMKKLVFSEARPVPDIAFADAAGTEKRLADWKGKWVLVNFWATWCAPCREEMPSLDALQKEFGGDRFEVVTIATGRTAEPAIRRFFEETGVTALPVLIDGKQALARQMGVLGLPVSVLIDPEGNEVARMLGDADWSGDSARAIVQAMIAGS